MSADGDERYPPWPDLTRWATVDPRRYPFERDTAAAVVRALAPPVPAPPPAGVRAWEVDGESRERARAWNHAMSRALIGHYGDWAHGWSYAPALGDYRGGPWLRHDYYGPIMRSGPETLALVAAELIGWRDHLERTADWIDQVRPTLVDAAGWEAAITHLLTTMPAWGDDVNGDVGPQPVTWLMDAAGMPADVTDPLLTEVFQGRRARYALRHLTAAETADLAEHITVRICDAVGGAVARPGRGDDDWPDTWPHHWPSWRATNLARHPEDRR